MQPPSQPPPSRRGRGSKRGGGVSHSAPQSGGPPPAPAPSGRGRGRGRGRGAKTSAQAGVRPLALISRFLSYIFLYIY